MVLVVVVRVLVVRRQNFQSPAARGTNTRGSVKRGSVTNAKFSNRGNRGSDTNAKFSKFSRAWYWY